MLPYIINQLLVRPREVKLREFIASRGSPLSSFRDLDMVMQECAYAICLRKLPAAYVVNLRGQPNAFTFGSDDDPVIVIDRRLIGSMGINELRAMLGHEMGHVKNGHMLYHTLAETLAGAVELSASIAGFGAVSMPLRFALLSWRRESEFSADRAALVAAGSPIHVVSMFARLGGISGILIQENASLLSRIAELSHTHPNLYDRSKAVLEFSTSDKYKDMTKKATDRKESRLAFSPTCRFCASAKCVGGEFCPECGRSQI
jgi:Zn-dependent protease with chaperone function